MRERTILLDERPLQFLIPSSVPDSQAVRMRRTLNTKRVQAALLRNIRRTLEQFRSLTPIQVRIG